MIYKMYSLPEIRFVGGSSEDLQFNMYSDEEKQNPFNLFGGEANFSIVNFINKNSTPLVSKRMEIGMNDAETHYQCCACFSGASRYCGSVWKVRLSDHTEGY